MKSLMPQHKEVNGPIKSELSSVTDIIVDVGPESKGDNWWSSDYLVEEFFLSKF